MSLTYKDEEKIKQIIEEAFDERSLDKKYDDIMIMLDKVMGELIKNREEQTVLSKHSKDQSDKLENHQSRLQSLEASLSPA